MKAIHTRLIPCTNTKPTRIKAEADGVKPLIVSLSGTPDRCGTVEEQHAYVAELFARRYGWEITRVCGAGLKPGSYVHVVIPESYTLAVEAVLATRYAIARGHNNGNPYSREYGQRVTELTDKNGELEEAYQEYKNTRPYVRSFLRRFTPPGGTPSDWVEEAFSPYHSTQFGAPLHADGLKREFAVGLVRRWNAASTEQNGNYQYKLEGDE